MTGYVTLIFNILFIIHFIDDKSNDNDALHPNTSYVLTIVVFNWLWTVMLLSNFFMTRKMPQ